ncbi:MAG: PIN domain-containing protein [Methanomassiliicoccaceae archaeon]|nr:PIN domain-containing protein [Methanomassiliicoccaceae archaeon]
MNVLFDTNVLLDIVLKREPFCSASLRAAEYALEGKITGFVSVQSLKDIFYFVSMVQGEENAFDIVEKLSILFRPIGVTSEDSMTAIMSDFRDYEDGLINASAVRNDIRAILTRDRAGFLESDLLIMSPSGLEEYLKADVTSGSIVLD